MKRCLIAYGNELRGDDGAAWELARRLQGWKIHCLPQLVPELVEQLKDADEVVFVDATPAGDDVRLERLEPREALAWPVHFGHPAHLLGLCRQLYGYCPGGFMLTLPGEDFDYRLGLSACAERSVVLGLRLLSGDALLSPQDR